MSENYLVINGKKMDLTEEQLKQLGIKVRKNPFEKVGNGRTYWCIKETGEIYSYWDNGGSLDNILYAESNYFTDEAIAKQVALHQLLYRKLLKFAYENEFEDTQEWNKTNCHYYISYNIDEGRFYADVTGNFKHNDVWFCSRKSAKRAIEEVVEPFIEEHPEFLW